MIKFGEKSNFSRDTETGESVGLTTNLVSEILLVFGMAELPKAGAGDIAARVAAQGDLVRKLKQEKADKEKVRKGQSNIQAIKDQSLGNICKAILCVIESYIYSIYFQTMNDLEMKYVCFSCLLTHGSTEGCGSTGSQTRL